MKRLPVSGVAIFSETVRKEVGRRFSIVGAYQHVSTQKKFPVEFPQIEVTVLANLDVEVPISSFSFKITSAGEILQENPAPREFIDFAFRSALEQGHPLVRFNTSIKMVGLEVDEPCRIEAIIVVDDVEYLIGFLDLLQDADASSAPLIAPPTT